MTEFITVQTTIDSQAAARKIAEALVQQRLAACVQVSGPITSTYWWQGGVEQAQEWVCTAKTRADLYPQVEAAIKAIHSYHVPEILATPVVSGNPAYLNWLKQETEL